jgi:hypothetical protein
MSPQLPDKVQAPRQEAQEANDRPFPLPQEDKTEEEEEEEVDETVRLFEPVQVGRSLWTA